jgi:hypothetical protein
MAYSRRRRCFKRRATAARARSIRINDLKSGGGETVLKIQSRAFQKRCAVVIDEKFNAIPLDHCVSALLLVERHFVMQTGTAAVGDVQAQTFARRFFLRREQGLKLSRCVLGNVNHLGHSTYDLAPPSQPTQEQLNG